MRFAERGLYVESYDKCANCGELMYESDEADRAGPAPGKRSAEYCSEWCRDWAAARSARRSDPPG